MTSAAGAIQDFLGTIAIIALVAVAYGVIRKACRRPWLAQVIVGAVFGAVSIQAMFDPVVIADGVFMDMRNVPVVLAGAFLGPGGMLVTTAMAAGMRGWMGGAGAFAGMMGILLAGLAGLAWGMRNATSGRRDARDLLRLAALATLHWIGIALLPPDLAWTFLHTTLPVFLPLETLGILVVSALLERERRLEIERRHLAEAADRDALTGLLNRRGFHRAVAGSLHGRGGALLLLDLDHFKQVNDTHGHPAGDAVLRNLGARLTGIVPSKGILARLGGEELAIFLPGGSPKAMRHLARHLGEVIRADPFALPLGGSVAVTVSIGGAWGGRRADLDALLMRADSALYAAKHAGRDCCRFAPEGVASVPDALEAESACDGCSGRDTCACGDGLVEWRTAAA
ncbi:diguanylate cyclase [Rubellimicrobium rubrum]|uniref:diguanylate cyclase n=1 Tax=Rubellimicrobium rubrum TaxID=2585369 RepID=A0A5C4MWP2_9RHOB|nr:diguanylate cyclase [Rubellimicrobium rubrum]TNC48335.1 diguanylate cyclase [Rubellimicrobium rubrum]